MGWDAASGVALARTLAVAPPVIVADESTSDLDAANRKRVIDALRARADAGAVVVMATYDADAAAELDAELRLDVVGGGPALAGHEVGDEGLTVESCTPTAPPHTSTPSAFTPRLIERAAGSCVYDIAGTLIVDFASSR